MGGRLTPAKGLLQVVSKTGFFSLLSYPLPMGVTLSPRRLRRTVKIVFIKSIQVIHLKCSQPNMCFECPRVGDRTREDATDGAREIPLNYHALKEVMENQRFIKIT